MAYGIYIKNTSQEIQISESHQNYILHSTGSVTVAGSTLWNSAQNSYLISFGSAGANVASDDMVFWYANRDFFCTGTTGAGIGNASTLSMTANWARFVKGNSIITPGTEYGIEVFSSNTLPVFSSNYRPLKINSASSQAVSITTASGTGSYVFAAPSTRPYNIVRSSISTGYVTYPAFDCDGQGTWSWSRSGIRRFTVTSSYTRTQPYYFLSLEI
jgi:hypothetical protein